MVQSHARSVSGCTLRMGWQELASYCGRWTVVSAFDSHSIARGSHSLVRSVQLGP